ncbi:TetR/AcrR family transcriptional regulator [Aldersonia sp. NBC_00410]|uniref:TetR/AcrR family transcriptional regulator n=1 Tax=Aldersonia sp. NBC_00410 TaxID=2975954 RepID=UPI002252A82A|nr:TetR/AcrR family transcriptional regulator [Aldersonia sp. NBC_00410]MCX5044811.1 TetR/AcrR family transcriptional regulator [Aldersonia sp. NBC_00410]
MPPPDFPLPVRGLPRADATAERRDAARNRRLLLDAATLLVADRGVAAVTMEAVAATAGVGKGTVFRRFGSRAGLMLALLDHSEQELQAAFMFGPPPLGPGAEPVDRLVAFGRARLAMVETQGDIMRAAESTRESRFDAPPYLVAVTHVSALLRAAGHREDVRLLADTLLAALDADLVLHQVRALHIPLPTIADRWADLARRMTPPN